MSAAGAGSGSAADDLASHEAVSRAASEEAQALFATVTSSPVTDAGTHVFHDTEFTPFVEYPDPLPAGVKNRAKGVTFRRPSEYLAGGGGGDSGDDAARDTSASASPAPALFGASEPQPGDVIEGELGDCFFLAALSCLAQQPKRVKALFLNDGVSAHGAYGVRLFYNGVWRTVVVDDQLPCKGARGKPHFGRSRQRNELWVSLLEKAYAKLYGSYDAICGGSMSEALRDLTGTPVRDINLENASNRAEAASGALWRHLRQDFAAGYIIGTAFVCPPDKPPPAKKMKGIMVNHAYGVLDVRDVKGNRLVRVRNPWGSFEWTGAWSDTSAKWTAEMRAAVGAAAPAPAAASGDRGADSDDGVFWMAFDDFCKVFNRLFVCMCKDGDALPGSPESEAAAATDTPFLRDDGSVEVRLRGAWAGESAGGSTGYPTWRRNPQYEVHVDRPCSLFITLAQPDRRLTHKTTGTLGYNQIGLTVLQMKPPATPEDAPHAARGADTWKDPRLVNGNYDVVMQTSYWNKRETSVDVDLEPTQAGRPYIIVPSTYFPGMEGGFWMTLEAQPRGPVAGRRASVPTPRAAPAAGAGAGDAGAAGSGVAGSSGGGSAAVPLVTVAPVDWSTQYPHTAVVQSEWKPKVRGGKASGGSFHTNPQYLVSFDNLPAAEVTAADATAAPAVAAGAPPAADSGEAAGVGDTAAAAAASPASDAGPPPDVIVFLAQESRKASKGRPEGDEGAYAPRYLVPHPAWKPLGYHGCGVYAAERCGRVLSSTNVNALSFLGKFTFSNPAEVARRVHVPEALPARADGTGAGDIPPVLLVPCTFQELKAARIEMTIMSTHPITVTEASSETEAAVARVYEGRPEPAKAAPKGGGRRARAGRRSSASKSNGAPRAAGSRRSSGGTGAGNGSATQSPAQPKAGRRRSGARRSGGAPAGAFAGASGGVSMQQAKQSQAGIASMYADLGI